MRIQFACGEVFCVGIELCGVVLNCVKSVNPEYFDNSCQKRGITLQPENTNVKKIVLLWLEK